MLCRDLNSDNPMAQSSLSFGEKMDWINRLSCSMAPYEEELTKGYLDIYQSKESARKEITESPACFLIGSIESVNQRIAHLDMKTNKCNSEDLGSRGFSSLVYDAQGKPLKAEQKQNKIESEQKVLEKFTHRYEHLFLEHHQETQDIGKKMLKSTPRMVELYQFSGRSDAGPTPLPYGIALDTIIDRVVSAHENTGGKICSPKEVRRNLSSLVTKEMILDCFWWIYLHKYKPDTECQKQLFDRVAENYIKLLGVTFDQHHGEAFLKVFPSVLSQAIYSSFCFSFPQSLYRFQTDDFRTQLCNLLWQWIGGISPSPGCYKTWDFHILEPEVDMVHGKQKQVSDIINGEGKTQGGFVTSTQTRIHRVTKESHPACCGPAFTHKLFSLSGHSPLVQYYLQENNSKPRTGINILVHRTEIKKQVISSMTYAELIKQGFQRLHKQEIEVNTKFRKRWKESLEFDRSLQNAKREFLKNEKQILSHKAEVKRISQQIFSDTKVAESLTAVMKSMEDQVVEEDVGFHDEESFFHDIEMLQKQGINVADIKKLKSVGICTIKGIQMTTRKALCNIKGLSEAKVEKIKEAANKVIEPGFLTAFEYSAKRRMVFHISTGSQEFDKLLGGGIESMAITETFGEFRTGKTQLAHTLCVTAQLPGPNGYTGGKIIFIDTENTFRPDRLHDIADRFSVDHDAVLDNVLYARAYTSEHQMELLDYVAAKFHEEPGIFKLLIIDSIMALFRVDFSGRGELAERQQKLAQMLSRLQKISEEYNVAVFVTNQMTADPGATMTFQADPKKPIGGHILAHASTTRISLRKGRGELRIAKIYDSPEMPENEATFAITSGGINDAKE